MMASKTVGDRECGTTVDASECAATLSEPLLCFVFHAISIAWLFFMPLKLPP